jgi:hypothetical protein
MTLEMNRKAVLWSAVASLVAVTITGCTAAGSAPATAPEQSESRTVPAPNSDASADCPDSGDGVQPWASTVSAPLVSLTEGDEGPAVRAAIYPRPDYEGNPWSQWGQGVVLSDGRFISAIGDHRGPDGNSYLYEYDPKRDQLTQISDVLSLTEHAEGEWGYGKIHAQMVVGPCDTVYAATYWGTSRDLVYEGDYGGDLLLRLDTAGRTIENLGPILEEHGVPSMAGWAAGGLLYAEAADPGSDPQRGALVVLDMATADQVFATPDEEDHRVFRAMAVDRQGRVVFSRDNGSLARWDPAGGEVADLDVVLPGEFLRAATAPAPDGTVYLATQNPDLFFAFGPDGDLRELGRAAGYTASMAMAPDGSRLWYVPDAHGGAAEQGTPIIEVDTRTGEQHTVVELDPLARDVLGLSLGGTYNIAVDDTGSTLYLGLNAAEPGAESLFGEVVLVIVALE